MHSQRTIRHFEFSFNLFTLIKVLDFLMKNVVPPTKQMTTVLPKIPSIQFPIPKETYDLIEKYSDRNPNSRSKLKRATNENSTGEFVVDGTELVECLLCSRYTVGDEMKEFDT